MKKISLFLTLLMFFTVFSYINVEAAYLPEYDKYVEITQEEAGIIAELLGVDELSEETARQSFELQEAIITELEQILGREIDRYYIWLTLNGTPVLAIDPPVAYY